MLISSDSIYLCVCFTTPPSPVPFAFPPLHPSTIQSYYLPPLLVYFYLYSFNQQDMLSVEVVPLQAPLTIMANTKTNEITFASTKRKEEKDKEKGLKWNNLFGEKTTTVVKTMRGNHWDIILKLLQPFVKIQK